MKVQTATIIANGLVHWMKPSVFQEPEILGSIRRGMEDVKDIEIIAMPKWEDVPDPDSLLGETMRVNRLHEYAETCGIRWIKTGTNEIIDWPIRPDGKYWRGIGHLGMKIDLFLAMPDNHGPIKLIRTGSAEFSKAVMSYANKHTEYRFKDGYLWHGERLVPVDTEWRVFELLGLVNVPPAQRIDGNSLRQISKGQRPI